VTSRQRGGGSKRLQDARKDFCPIHGTPLTESPYENSEVDFCWACENEWETAWIAHVKNPLPSNPMR